MRKRERGGGSKRGGRYKLSHMTRLTEFRDVVYMGRPGHLPRFQITCTGQATDRISSGASGVSPWLLRPRSWKVNTIKALIESGIACWTSCQDQQDQSSLPKLHVTLTSALLSGRMSLWLVYFWRQRTLVGFQGIHSALGRSLKVFWHFQVIWIILANCLHQWL